MNHSQQAQSAFERRGFAFDRGLLAREETWSVADALRHGHEVEAASTLSRHHGVAAMSSQLIGSSLLLTDCAVDHSPAKRGDFAAELIVAIFLGDLDPCECALLVAPGSHLVARPAMPGDLEIYLDWMASGCELEMLSGPAGSVVFLDPRLFFMVSRAPGAQSRTILFLSYGPTSGDRPWLDEATLWPPAHAWTAG